MQLRYPAISTCHHRHIILTLYLCLHEVFEKPTKPGQLISCFFWGGYGWQVYALTDLVVFNGNLTTKRFFNFPGSQQGGPKRP